MEQLHLYDDIFINIEDIKSIEFKKDKKCFVTKELQDNYYRYILDKNIYYGTGTYIPEALIDNIKNKIGKEKTVEFILIKLKGDHVHIIYNILDNEDVYINEDGQYIELGINNQRLRIGEPAVYYWLKTKYVKPIYKFNEIKEYILNNVL